jgi:hypothetical protein
MVVLNAVQLTVYTPQQVKLSATEEPLPDAPADAGQVEELMLQE